MAGFAHVFIQKKISNYIAAEGIASVEKNRENKFFIFSAAILLAISVFLHFWQIGEVPNGFLYDESSIGYNAYSMNSINFK